MLNNLYHAQDCHCGIPILEPEENICSECKRSKCSENYGCMVARMIPAAFTVRQRRDRRQFKYETED